MHYLVGLGNPGQSYVQSRHNVGWQYLDFLQKKLEFPAFSSKKKFFADLSVKDSVSLCKPTTYMNRSGQAIAAILQFYEKEQAQGSIAQQSWLNVCVVHDDLDIPIGSYKLQFGTGPKVHNGVNSVREFLGSNFWYLRVGVDGRSGQRTMPGQEYVLRPFLEHEKESIEQVFFQMTNDVLEKFLS